MKILRGDTFLEASEYNANTVKKAKENADILTGFAGNKNGLNTLRPRQNGHHLADDIFKRMFLNENIWIWIKMSIYVALD